MEKDQELLVNVWSIPAPGANRAHTGYTVTFTKPDGTKDVIGPFNSYVADGTNWFTYTPDQAGNWTVQFTYPGDYYPAGRYVNGVLNNSAPAGSSFMDQRDYPVNMVQTSGNTSTKTCGTRRTGNVVVFTIAN